MRILVKTHTASFFVKVGVTTYTSEALRSEISAYLLLRGDFMPELVAYDDTAAEPILIIQDLSQADWRPDWERGRVDLVLKSIDEMHGMSAKLEPYTSLQQSFDSNWYAVASNPEPFLSLGIAGKDWLEAALPKLIANQDDCRTEGRSLCHWDLRSDNICTTQGKAVFVDWNMACLSNPKLDLGLWLPSLEFEGGPKPEVILPNAPEVAAWVSGFFAARAGLPDISDAPRVRKVQRQQLQTALPWALRAIGLPPLPKQRAL